MVIYEGVAIMTGREGRREAMCFIYRPVGFILVLHGLELEAQGAFAGFQVMPDLIGCFPAADDKGGVADLAPAQAVIGM